MKNNSCGALTKGKPKILFIGFGNIVLRHIGNCRLLFPAASMAVLRLHGNSAAEHPEIGQTFFAIDKAEAWGADFVFVTSPAPFHIENALRFAAAGAHLYIEKPLSLCMDNIDFLAGLAREKQCVVEVGYQLRFHRGLARLRDELDKGICGRIFSVRAECGQWLGDWRPAKDYRDTVTASAGLGGGAVYELSHDVDYLLYLFGDVCRVFCSTAKVSELEIDVEDTADLILLFKNGVRASLHLDLLRRDVTRICVVSGEKGTLSFDFIANRLSFYDAAVRSERVLYEEPDLPGNLAYLDCLRDFFSAAREGTQASNSLQQGCRTLRTLLAAKKSSATDMPQPVAGITFSTGC